VFFAYFLLVDGEYWPQGQTRDARCADRARLSRESASQARGSVEEMMKFIDKAESKARHAGLRDRRRGAEGGLARTQQRLGYTGRAPRWAIAYKFTAKSGITQVNDIMIRWAAPASSRPRRMLTPVFIGGTTVSRATLHNADFIERLGLLIGDWVKVERGGDVIPKVVEVIEDAEHPRGNARISFPTELPGVRQRRGARRRRSRLALRERRLPGQAAREPAPLWQPRRDEHRGAGRRGGAAVARPRPGAKRGRSLLADRGATVGLERFAEKSARALLEEIERSKSAGLARVLMGLGIRFVGERTAELLAQEFGSIDALMAATPRNWSAWKKWVRASRRRFWSSFAAGKPRAGEEL
jgi:DNA ligase (NAD+)